MIPRISQRGQSFKGAGMYYLRDKDAQTNERVEWTYTHNLPTNDADKAMRYMAYTAMNAEKLKQEAGVPQTGRKSKRPVYSFSLSWHPDQSPEQPEMHNAALDVLVQIGLDDHEAVFVAHNETEHPHVHVICNLVHPETGKTAVPSYDFLTTSQWAEKYERDSGEILCEQRVKNNAERKREAEEKRKLALIKHKEEKLQRATLIEQLYNQSDCGKSFQAALESEGYTLAKGDRRGFVLVDRNGETYSLSRQLKGQRAKDINSRIGDVGQIPMAKQLSEEMKHFDRDKYESERQNKMLDAAMTSAKQNRTPLKREVPNNPKYDDEHLKKLDALRSWEQKTQRMRDKLSKQNASFYNSSEVQKEIEVLRKELEKPQGLISKISGTISEKQDRLEKLQLNLDNINQRIDEQESALERKIEKMKSTEDIVKDEKKCPEGYRYIYRNAPPSNKGPGMDR